MKKSKPLNIRAYWDEVGTDNIARIVERLGSSMGYFRHLRSGRKKPSGDMALKIVEAAKVVTPGFEPDLKLLLRGAPVQAPASPKIEPSAAFLASRKPRSPRRVAA